ncbi:MAG: acyl-ACP--UDP-N-acetylglucosamine O-acyltransferase [Planctomycetota bacterium]
MPQVHPTAIVSPDATLAEDAVVGPFCTVGEGVTLGPGSRLISHVVLQGPLTMGQGNVVYPFACLGLAPQDLKVDPAEPGHGVVIGDGNVIRESVTIHRGYHDRPTSLADRNYLMVNSHLGHDVAMGSDCMIANGAVLGGHVVVGDRVTLGGNAGVHQFVRIGRMAIVTGAEGFTVDIPPFCGANRRNQAYGINVVGLRRAGLREHIGPLRQAYRILFLQGLPNPQAVARIREDLGDDPLCRELADFVEASKRGVLRAVDAERQSRANGD